MPAAPLCARRGKRAAAARHSNARNSKPCAAGWPRRMRGLPARNRGRRTGGGW